MRGRGERILIRGRDTDPASWAMARGAFLYDPDVHVAAHNWNGVFDQLERLLPTIKGPVEQVQVWGHGNVAAPRIGKSLTTKQLINLANLLGPYLDEASVVWWRMCYTFKGAKGKAFARQGADLFGCLHAGHTHETSSLPWLIFQSGVRVIRPGDTPTWADKEGGKSALWKPRTILATKMQIPKRWLVDKEGDDGIPAIFTEAR